MKRKRKNKENFLREKKRREKLQRERKKREKFSSKFPTPFFHSLPTHQLKYHKHRNFFWQLHIGNFYEKKTKKQQTQQKKK